MRRNNSNVNGFTLITAIFLLVVVATLSVYMLNLRTVQQQTLVYGVQGARAMQAARTGIEWAINQSLATGLPFCDAPHQFNLPDDAALSAFEITVTCTVSTHIEGATSIDTFQLTATAQTGDFGTLDYVSRLLQATISRKPP